jgi:hypothetical protein
MSNYKDFEPSKSRAMEARSFMFNTLAHHQKQSNG